MTSTHQTILAELYEIDPSLREHEAELLPLVQKLLANDPAQKPSPAFVKKLRAELKARAAASINGAIEYRASYAPPSAFTSFFNRFAYAAAGAVAAVVIAVPVTMQFMNGDQFYAPTSPTDNEMAMKAESDGFTTTDQANPMPTGNNPAPGAYSRTQSGGGGMGGMDGGMSTSMLIAPWNPVKYRLEGDLPALPSGDVEVLERNTRPLNIPFSGIQNAFRDAAIDLSSFDGTTVDHVSITQRRQFGYTINLSTIDGSVSINQAWEFWPHPENNCRDEECYRNLQPKLSDIPADAEVIRIANAFMNEHDIALDGYGSPVVDDTWRIQYDSMADKRYAYVPESVRVIYPLLIDGEPVFESGGEPTGISVQVSIKHKRVSDAWGLTTYQFDSENHAPVSDRGAIEEFLSTAGSQMPDAPTVTLSNPTLGMVRMYLYENNTSRELFVPALIFQMPAMPEGIGYYQRAVAVPLAQDLLEKATPPPMPIDPYPMPMPRPMDGGGPAIDVPADERLIMEEEAAAR